MPAHAALIVSMSPVTVAAGTSGATFEVDLQNTGSVQNIAAFTLGLSVDVSSGVTFTGGSESTADTYLFNGDSFDVINGFPFTTVPPPDGPVLEASDLSNSGTGTDMGLTTLGLALITFNVAPGTLGGPVTVTIAPDCASPNACTSFADSAGDNLAFSVVNGTINVTAAVSGVPEPSTWLLCLFGLPAIAWRKKSLRKLLS